ncbi:MAG TPA: acyl transferase [Chitinophagaceae bacterium]|nr:acyl transferase [Chitinophagaceae bacterium]
MNCEWHDKIFLVQENSFEQLALAIFRFQYDANTVYKSYVNALGIKPAVIDKIEKIPFLPISFFKTDEIKTGKFNAEEIFESSGTTQSVNSRHHVKSISIYTESFTKAFENIHGSITEWCILGLLPSYLERGNSSLVYMVDCLITKSQHPLSGFYLHDFDKLKDTLISLERGGQKTLLVGVTYALLDFAENFPVKLSHTTIMETGGMKGRRKELTRPEVHEQLKKAFGKTEIHSEYGMTELLSQAYAEKEGRFRCPKWMKVLIRDDEDPLTVQRSSDSSHDNESKPLTGAINVIDLANVYSCSFIATDDAGKLYPDDSFEVLGRIDGSDLRGCSLLAV